MNQTSNTDQRLMDAANSLALARKHRQPTPRVSEAFELADLDEAYYVQTISKQRALTQGRRLSGAKAGLTSTALRSALKVEEPLYGWLFEDTAHTSGDTLDWEQLIQPKVEIEIALVLSADLPMDTISPEQLMASIAGAVPALEINDSAITGWQLTLLDAVADNLSSGLYVLGNNPVPLTALEGRPLSATLLINSQPVRCDVHIELDEILATALWLTRKLAALGHSLHAGDVLLTGALAPIAEINQGDRLCLQIDGLGDVKCLFK